MGIAAVLTTEVAIEPSDTLEEVYAFVAGQDAPADAAVLAMRRHVSAITVRDASACGGQILACVLVIEPSCHGYHLSRGAELPANFFLVGEVHVSPTIEPFRREVQEMLVAAAITQIETTLGNRSDRSPSCVVLLHDRDSEGRDLLQRLAATRLGFVGEQVSVIEQELGLPGSRPLDGWVVRAAALPGAAALTLAVEARPHFAQRRWNAVAQREELLSVRSRLPWAGALKPYVEALAKGEVEPEWQMPPTSVFFGRIREVEDRHG